MIAVGFVYRQDLLRFRKLKVVRTYAGLSQKKSHLLDRGDQLRKALSHFQNMRMECGVEGELAVYRAANGYFPICIHSKVDMISDRIRQYGVWDDCEDLVWFLWNEFEGGPGGGGYHRERGKLSIMDVGANIGSCSIRLALLGHTVLSFEPDESNYKLFERSIQLNNLSDSLLIFKAGASDIRGEGSLVVEKGNAGNAVIVPQQSTDNELSRIKELVRSVENSTFSYPYPVSLVRLEPYIRDLGRVHLLKLDCQGCELAALRGADASLAAGRVRSVVVEFSPAHLRAAGEDPAGLLEALAAHGFTVSTLVMGTHVPPQEFRDFAGRRNSAPIMLHGRHASIVAGVPTAQRRLTWTLCGAAAAAGAATAAWIFRRRREGRDSLGARGKRRD